MQYYVEIMSEVILYPVRFIICIYFICLVINNVISKSCKIIIQAYASCLPGFCNHQTFLYIVCVHNHHRIYQQVFCSIRLADKEVCYHCLICQVCCLIRKQHCKTTWRLLHNHSLKNNNFQVQDIFQKMGCLQLS